MKNLTPRLELFLLKLIGFNDQLLAATTATVTVILSITQLFEVQVSALFREEGPKTGCFRAVMTSDTSSSCTFSLC